MPKNPERNVKGRKIDMSQLSRQRLAFRSRDLRVSRMATDLYIFGIGDPVNVCSSFNRIWVSSTNHVQQVSRRLDEFVLHEVAASI